MVNACSVSNDIYIFQYVFIEYSTSATGDSSSIPAESSTSLQVASTEAEESVTTESDGLTTLSSFPGEHKYFIW